MEYKVGKKYRSSKYPSSSLYPNTLWICAWVQKRIGIAAFESVDDTLDVIIAYPYDTFWEEVKEKITVTKYVHWYFREDGLADTITTPNPVPNPKSYISENYIKTDMITCEVEEK